MVTRANVEATKKFIRERLGNPYVYGGALSLNVKQGTDCSEVWQSVLEMVHGRWRQGRQSEGATTESYRYIPVGGIGPFGTIRVNHWRDIPANAAAKIAFHHEGNGGRSSHMWGELDGMRIESGGSKGLVTGDRAMALADPYANAWAYLPGPILADGTPAPPEPVYLGQQYENYGERVRQLQEALNRKGASLDVDGEFGPLTEAAVRAYQQSEGLEGDGVAGPVTLTRLGLTFGAPEYDAGQDADVLARATGLPIARAKQILPTMVDGLRKADCTNPNRIAMFIAQTGHESAGFNATEEYQSGDESTERWRYKGRTWIQLTWLAAYRGFGKWCFERGLVSDPEVFVKNPKSLADLKWAGLGAAYYWTVQRPNINALSDRRDLLNVSREINGRVVTPNGMPDRTARYNRALALGGELLSLLSTERPTDTFEELMMMEVESLSIYATPGEPKIPVHVMIQSLDAHGPHEPYVEQKAREGDRDAIMRVARTAAGKGKYGASAGPVSQATRILIELENSGVLTEYLKGK